MKGQTMSFSTATATASTTAKLPPYLSLHRNALIFRIRIPSDLQPCLGKTEYRRSIGSSYHREAKPRALKLASAAFEVFAFAREALEARARNEDLTHSRSKGKEHSTEKNGYTSQTDKQEYSHVGQDNSGNGEGYTKKTQFDEQLKGRTLASLTDEEIRSIAEEWLLASLQGASGLTLRLAMNRQARGRGKAVSVTKEDEAFHYEADLATTIKLKSIYQEALRYKRVGRMGKAADTQLALRGVECNPATESHTALEQTPEAVSQPYLKMCLELLKAHASFHSVIENVNIQGNYETHDALVESLEAKQEARREKRRQRKSANAEEAPLQVITTANGQTITATTPIVQAQQTLLLSEALEKFMDESVRMKKWIPTSRSKKATMLHLFRDIVDLEGKLPVCAVGVPHFDRYVSTLMGYPEVSARKREYGALAKGELFRKAEAGEIPEEQRISTTTVVNHCQTVISFMSWAGKRGHHPSPALAGILKEPKRAKGGAETEDNESARDPFTVEDIKRLFNPAVFLRAGLDQLREGRQGASPARFWVPLLGLFTGARLEELAQLHLDDFVFVDQTRNVRKIFSLSAGEGGDLSAQRQEGETVCIHINRSKDFQKLKNAASQRYVPLSSVLVDDLRFLDYVASVFAKAKVEMERGTMATDGGRIFPELKKTPSADKYSHKLSHWFREYRRTVSVGVGEEEGKKVFHSFRNTISFWCDQQVNIQEKAAARYVGHAVKGITFRTYSKDTLPHILYEQITEPFTEWAKGNLDVEGLKASPFVQVGEAVAVGETGERQGKLLVDSLSLDEFRENVL